MKRILLWTPFFGVNDNEFGLGCTFFFLSLKPTPVIEISTHCKFSSPIVDSSTADDAGVYRRDSDIYLIGLYGDRLLNNTEHLLGHPGGHRNICYTNNVVAVP